MPPRLRTKDFLALASLQILLSTKDFENEKLDRQNMQHQLQKVLKELRKARDQISKLESAVSASAARKLLFLEPEVGDGQIKLTVKAEVAVFFYDLEAVKQPVLGARLLQQRGV